MATYAARMRRWTWIEYENLIEVRPLAMPSAAIRVADLLP